MKMNAVDIYSEKKTDMLRLDLTGQRFGELTALAPILVGKNWKWSCACSCGGSAIEPAFKLRKGHKRSCGHLKNAPKHGHAQPGNHSLIYDVWSQMRDRCNNPRNKRYARYGGRGIRVCERWNDFSVFLADMGQRPPRTSLDRKDNDGNYEPTNCRWASSTVQANNSTKNRILEFNGESLTLAQWSRRLNISAELVRGRLNAGWPVDKALTLPIHTKFRRKSVRWLLNLKG